MTDTDSAPEPLDESSAARLAEFARGCKAAARAVSLYPDGHPWVESSLKRMVEIGRRVIGTAPLALTILPNQLLLDRRATEKPDPAISEFAALLHRHQLGRVVLNDGADTDTWLTFFRLLSRSPEAVRDDGGIAHLWGEAGGLTTLQQRVSLELQEVNYEKMLSGAGETAAALEQIIEACLGDTPLVEFDEATRAAMLEMVGDEAKLRAVAAELRARAGEQDAGSQVNALFQFMRNAASVLDPSDPAQIDRAFRNMATVVGDLSAEAMTELLDKQHTEEATVGAINVVGAAVGHMGDENIANFVAGSIIQQGGATDRLAQAFQALIPDIDSQRQLLSLAEYQVADSPIGKQEDFPDVWRHTEEMLTSYSDEKFVGKDYARELSQARAHAVEIDEMNEDPPERISGWLGSVDDMALRDLDLQLLLELLELEQDAHRWRDITDAVIRAIEELIRTGKVDTAARLVERLATERGEADDIPADEESKRAFALAALERLATGPAMRHALGQLRQNDEDTSKAVGELCTVLGPMVVTSLAEVLASEQDARARRRLRDILISFDKFRQEGARSGPATAQRPELGSATDGGVPAAGVRRHGRDARARASPHRLRAAGATRGDPGPRAHRRRADLRGIRPRPHEHQERVSEPRDAHPTADLTARPTGGAPLPPPDPAHQSHDARRRLPGRDRDARHHRRRRRGAPAAPGALPR